MIASSLIELCKKGKFIQAQNELYDEDIISIEIDGTRTTGAKKMQEKEQRFLDNLVRIHDIDFSETLIARNYFSTVLKMKIEIRNVGFKELEEMCVYHIKNGKIDFEQFFRDGD